MNRIFNITGPCDPKRHYMIDALRRLGDEIFTLISQAEYFIIHAARQSGKTTLLLELTRLLNNGGKYHALYCSLENAQAAPDAAEGIPAVINSVQNALEAYGAPHAGMFAKDINFGDHYNSLQKALTKYCKLLDKPLVLLFDEADCLSGQTLISFLRQLRSGYINRVNIPFIHSLALAGMRNIRDYRDEYRNPGSTLGSASPFNITAATMTLQNFTRNEVAELYSQYTEDTGREFGWDALSLVQAQTQGQPWLVNAIAREVVTSGNASMEAIGAEPVTAAIQALVLKRDTHFDSLLARLHEDRVRQVVEPIIIGKEAAVRRYSDDYGYVKDLGLIRDDQGKTEFANPIYSEIIIRSLNWDTQKELEETAPQYQMPRYIKEDAIDMDSLLKDFQAFWRENSDIWQKKYDYQEAAPQLVLQAFLQRVLNGGGSIVREMAAGAGRADICVIYNGEKYPVEMKIRRGESTYGAGAEQILKYMDILGCGAGWLVVFDDRSAVSWDEKIFSKAINAGGKTVMLYGC